MRIGASPRHASGSYLGNNEIAERLGVSRPTVMAWPKRYTREGLTSDMPPTSTSGSRPG
jgi:transposase